MKRHVKITISVCVFVVLTAARLARRMFGLRRRPYLTILFYHAVPPAQTEAFARQMRQLARWARVVPANWDSDAADPPAPERRYIVAITFDDAFESVLDNALPVLAARGFHCTIFVPSGNLGRSPLWKMQETNADRTERVADTERLSRLPADLVAIGSHSVTHPYLTALPNEAVRHELARSKQDLAALSGRDVRLFAIPYGDHDAGVIAMCRICGYEQVFTIEPRPVVPAEQAFTRGRIALDPTDGRLEFFLKATGSYRWMAGVSAIKRTMRNWRAAMPNADAAALHGPRV